MNLESVGRFLVGLGLLSCLIGAIFLVLSRVGISKLPGDILIRRGNTTFFFPIVSAVLVSVILTIVLNLLYWFWRR